MARYCTKCGKELIDNENKCKNCETKITKSIDLQKVIYIVIGLICVILVCSISMGTKNNKKQKITLNEEEKELVSVINKIKLKNTTFKKVCNKLYEVRKTKDTNGDTVYIFDMEANTVAIVESKAMDLLKQNMTGLSEKNTERRKYYLKDNKFILCTFSGKDYTNQSAEALIAFSISNSTIEEMWEEGKSYNNVNYEKILKSL